MTVWTERPHEEANLLNPAFCCLGMTAAIAGYQAEANQRSASSRSPHIASHVDSGQCIGARVIPRASYFVEAIYS